MALGLETSADQRWAGRPGGEQLEPYVAGIWCAIRKNPQLKVFSANGYFDLATPFFNGVRSGAYELLDRLRGKSSSGTIRRGT